MLNKTLLLIVILSFLACSSEKDKMIGDYSLDVVDNISGSLSNSFSVTNAVLKVSDKSFGTKLLVEVKRTASELPFDSKDAQVCGTSSGKPYEWCITADILGENNIPIETNLDKYGSDPFKKSISLQEGETIWLEFTIGYRSELESNPNKAKSVKLVSSLEKQELSQISESSSSELVDDFSPNTPSNEDWDKVLDDYDDYVEKYIKFYEKAMAGDATAMSEYPALMQKAQSFAEKLQNASGDLSLEQTGRMMKIQTKMIEGLTK